MAPRMHESLKQILHPYVFVLKEGTKIKQDYLDYSLLMLQVTNPEIIQSPEKADQDYPAYPMLSHPFNTQI